MEQAAPSTIVLDSSQNFIASPVGTAETPVYSHVRPVVVKIYLAVTSLSRPRT